MKSESVVQQEILLEAAKYGIKLMRNNSGALKDETGRVVRYGLDNTSALVNEHFKSSDLIGIWKREPWCGLCHDVGVFVAIEVKREDWEYTGTPREIAQKAFIDYIIARGGFAGFCNSVDSFLRLIGKI